MIAYCGIDCRTCRAHRATVKGDAELLEEAAKGFWDGSYSAEEWVCLGCRPADQPFLAKFCAECKIRACAIARGLSNCAACGDFEECTKLQEFIQGESEALVRTMASLRRRFLDRGRGAQSPMGSNG